MTALGWLALAGAIGLSATSGPGSARHAPHRTSGSAGPGASDRRPRRVGRAAASRSAPRLVAFVADLLAALLAAGAAPEHAIAAVSAAVDAVGSAPLRAVVEPLARTGRLLELGTEPSDAWAGLARLPEYREIALAGQRCARSGARLSGALATAAAQLRMARRTGAVERATAVGVWAMLPLGVCFLPAFVCLGVVPVVIGIAGPALAGAQ